MKKKQVDKYRKTALDYFSAVINSSSEPRATKMEAARELLGGSYGAIDYDPIEVEDDTKS